MKIALVQMNPIVGDFTGNCARIRSWAIKAKDRGCNLVIFSELVVSGYPPQDLLQRPSFIAAHETAVHGLVAELPDIDVMFGCFEVRHGDRGKKLFNSAVVARQGKLVFRVRKQLLPSYDVFDETRYFEPGPASSQLYELQGLKFGVTVCEDVWGAELNEYDIEPVASLFKHATTKRKSIDAIINISASPFQRGKESIRKKIFAEISRRYSVPFLYCNQIGGQDSLVFDGRSMAQDACGDIVAMGLSFKEDMIVVDSGDWRGDMHGAPRISERASVYQGLVMGLGDYVHKCHFSSVVLGLSGGIDSALAAAIAVDAIGPENVLGVALPSPYSSQDSLEDATRLAKNLSCRFELIPIAEIFHCFLRNLEPLFKGLDADLTEQNLQARIRGNLLMALSNQFGHLLLNTGNKTEMAVGYCTLYGDMSGGLAVLSDVPKMLVYELASYVNKDGEIIPARIITRAPTAELKPNQKDQDDLPPYEVLDLILELYLEQGKSLREIVDHGLKEQMVGDILQRVRNNEHKRKQAPMGLKVTGKAFGSGRRYPNVQHYLG